MSIFHRRAKAIAPQERQKTQDVATSKPEAAADSGVVVACQKCGHKHAITLTAGRAQGGTFAMCPQCNSGGVYDEYGTAYSPAQHAAESIVRKYGRG